jgi:hypothetical protein
MADKQVELRVKDRVEAADDTLRGVAAGTPGQIIGVSGLDWIRYRVKFDNGWEHNLVDAKHLRRRPEDDD